MPDDKKEPRIVDVRPVAHCEEHMSTIAMVREADGSTHMARISHDPENREDLPDIKFNSAKPDAEGWHRGHVARRGPPRVNSVAYQQGWDRIFGNKTVAEA